MHTIAEALDAMLPAFTPRSPVRASLSEAQNAFSSEDVRAQQDSPPFDNSAMDGYAVRAEDLSNASVGAPVRLPLRGESRAGGDLPRTLEGGTAMRIFTGAPLPEDADAVVMQENVSVEDGTVCFDAPASPHQHVRRAGEDLCAGAIMLPRGTHIGPGEIGLLASQRFGSVMVHRRPVVAILATGDELRDVSDPPEPGTIVDSNSHALAAQVREAGAVPRVLTRAGDDLETITARVREGLEADVLLSIGGVSVGSYDFVHEAFARVGVEPRFAKVRIKPGKPIAFGMAGDVPVVGIPGNPVSAMVTFEVFVRPGLRRMLGDPRPFVLPLAAVLGSEVRRRAGRPELLRVTLRSEDGHLVATPHARQGSGALPSVSLVDGLAMVPEDAMHLPEGHPIRVIPLRSRPGTDRSPFPAP